MRCCHSPRSSISVWRRRTFERSSRIASGGIHDLRYPPGLEQLAQPAGVLAIGLGALLGGRAARSSPPARPDAPGRPPLELLDHEAPARRPTKRTPRHPLPSVGVAATLLRGGGRRYRRPPGRRRPDRWLAHSHALVLRLVTRE